ncbi:MAG: hypothetical protein U1G07_21665 [Verrucomicrobiota bacterium]
MKTKDARGRLGCAFGAFLLSMTIATAGAQPARATLSSTNTLAHRMAAGRLVLRHEAGTGYLRSLLAELGIAEESQVLVFSKTSAQRENISPRHPRAIYFNDHAYVAWVPEAPILEISVVDPREGAVFYAIQQLAAPDPRLVRHDQCLECHTSDKTLHVPGYIVRSYPTDRNGVIDITAGSSMVDHRTPFAERWGGWYISGHPGTALHRGRQIEAATKEHEATGTEAQLEIGRYPQPTSDVVALLVLEHQAQMQNLLTRAQRNDFPTARAGSLSRRDDPVEELVRYLLFVDEAPLSKPVVSAGRFAAWFEQQGPADSQHRSLRQLDLQTRLFKYPCSYMIYSESYEALPRDVRLKIYRRLWTILNGEDRDPAFAAIPAETKRAILEILIQTKADVPISWKL